MWGYLSNLDNDLFGPLERMRRELDTVFGVPRTTGIRSASAGSFPAINIGVSPKRVDVYCFAAGLDPKALELMVQDNLLTLAGERRVTLPEGVQTYRRERFNSGFRRVITLPEDVDPDQVEATYRNGLLQVTIARREEVRPRRIEVR